MTLIGASWTPADAPARGPVRPIREEVGHFVDSVSAQWPHLRLERSVIRYAVAGLYPFFGGHRVDRDSYQVARKPLVWDHGARGGPRGLVTAIGVKLTTAAAVAERIVDRCSAPSTLRGRRRPAASLGPLEFASPSSIPELGFEPIRDPATATRLARAGAEREQALTLEDLFLRRCVAGQFGLPAREVLDAAAAELARIHGWSVDRTAREVAEFESKCSELKAKAEDSEDGS
jgi:glycerol-3-phosphate dehydrogenase